MRARLIVAILALVATLPAAAQPCGPFVDVDQDDVFCSDVLWMRNHNVTLGCTATTYCPSENVTRAQMALFMRRLASSMIPAGIITVAQANADFTSIQAAVDAGAAASDGITPTIVRVGPGVYNERVVMKPFVILQGAGIGATQIVFDGTGGTVAVGANRAEVRDVTIVNTHNGTSPGAVAVSQGTGTATLRRVAATAAGATDNTAISVTGGFMSLSNGEVLTDPSATASGVSYGVHAAGTATVDIRDAFIADGQFQLANRRSVRADALATVRIAFTRLFADTQGGPTRFNTYDFFYAPKPCP